MIEIVATMSLPNDGQTETSRKNAACANTKVLTRVRITQIRKHFMEVEWGSEAMLISHIYDV